MSVEVSVTLDGNRCPGGRLARRIRRQGRVQCLAARHGFLQTERQTESAAVQEARRSGNQSQPLEQAGPMEFLGIEDQFFTATFIPDGTDLSLWHWTQDSQHHRRRQAGSRTEAEMAAGTTLAAPLRMRDVCRPEGSGDLSKEKPSLEELVNSAGPASLPSRCFYLQVAASLHSELGLGDRRSYADHQLRVVPAEDEELALDAEDAEGGARNPRDSGSLQEIFDERSAQTEDERRSDGHLPARRHQSVGELPADAVADADLVGAVARAERARSSCGMRPGCGWIHDLSAKDPYYILPVAMAITMYLIDQDDAANDASIPSQQKMMAPHAADDGRVLFPAFERAQSVYVHQQPGRRGPAVLSEPHATAAGAQVKVQEEKRMSEERAIAGKRPTGTEYPAGRCTARPRARDPRS